KEVGSDDLALVAEGGVQGTGAEQRPVFERFQLGPEEPRPGRTAPPPRVRGEQPLCPPMPQMKRHDLTPYHPRIACLPSQGNAQPAGESASARKESAAVRPGALAGSPGKWPSAAGLRGPPARRGRAGRSGSPSR